MLVFVCTTATVALVLRVRVIQDGTTGMSLTFFDPALDSEWTEMIWSESNLVYADGERRRQKQNCRLHREEEGKGGWTGLEERISDVGNECRGK